VAMNASGDSSAMTHLSDIERDGREQDGSSGRLYRNWASCCPSVCHSVPRAMTRRLVVTFLLLSLPLMPAAFVGSTRLHQAANVWERSP
jgi:hypothetical protein